MMQKIMISPRHYPFKSIKHQKHLEGMKPQEFTREGIGRKEMPSSNYGGRKKMKTSTTQHGLAPSSFNFGHRLKHRFHRFRQLQNNCIKAINSNHMTQKSIMTKNESSLSRQLTKDLDALHIEDDDDDNNSVPSVPQQLDNDTNTNDSNCDHFTRCIHEMVRTKQSRQHFLQTSEQQKHLKREINHDFSEMILLDQARGEVGVQLHLLAASHVLKEFFALVQTCKFVQTNKKNKDNTIQRDIFQVLEQYILPRIALHYDSQMNQTSLEDTARIIVWIDKFLNDMDGICPHIIVDTSWRSDQDRLINHYLEKSVRPEMQSLMERAVEMQSKDGAVQLHKCSEGNTSYLGTDLVDQVDSMYQHQLSAARDLLPPTAAYQERVFAACNQQLARSVCDLQLKISAEWKETGIRRFCAIINDALRLSKQCEQRNQVVLKSLQFQREGLALTRDLSELALHATQYLGERILLDLRDPQAVLTNAEGDHDDTNRPEAITSLIPIDQAVTMLKRRFETIETWLSDPDVYIPKLLKNCFNLILSTYVESFFANTLARGVKDAAAVAQGIRQDYLSLVIFFNGACCVKYHAGRNNDGGEFYTQFVINERLRILQSVAALLDPSITQPANMKGDIKVILSSFASGENGSAVILHLAGLRKRHCSNAESLMWVKAIASAKKEMAIRVAKKQGQTRGDDDSDNDNDDDDDDNTSSISSSTMSATDAAVMDLHVPDLRNSKYLLNLRPPKITQREMSAGTRPFAESTLRLLQGR